jgi:hypothetical protein
MTIVEVRFAIGEHRKFDVASVDEAAETLSQLGDTEWSSHLIHPNAWAVRVTAPYTGRPVALAVVTDHG